MKKFLLLLSFSIFTIDLSAQITITAADMAVPPKRFYQATDTIPTITIGAAGTNQVWNMVTLKNHIKDTLTVLVPSSTPYAAKFPTSNLAYKAGGGYVYLTNSATELLGNGIAADSIFIFSASPAEVILKYPTIYGTTFTNTSGTDLKIKSPFPIADSARLKSIKVKTATVDAWGSITTPYGTFNCLRMKEINHSTDSTFIKPLGGTWMLQNAQKDSSKTYNWLTNNMGFPLVSVEVNFKTDSIENVSWLTLSGTVGIPKNVSAIDVNVYPNPAQNDVQFKLDAGKATGLQIFDIAGRMVYSTTITNALTRVSVSEFANGIYNYTIIGKENQIVHRGKFNVVK